MSSPEVANPLTHEAALVRRAVVCAELGHVSSRLVAEAFGVVNQRTCELYPDLLNGNKANGQHAPEKLSAIALPANAESSAAEEPFHFFAAANQELTNERIMGGHFYKGNTKPTITIAKTIIGRLYDR